MVASNTALLRDPLKMRPGTVELAGQERKFSLLISIPNKTDLYSCHRLRLCVKYDLG